MFFKIDYYGSEISPDAADPIVTERVAYSLTSLRTFADIRVLNGAESTSG
ncbi:hypothetical protein [Bradyrhizobium sp.]